MKQENSLGDKLVAQERTNEALERRYNKEIEAMLERGLKPVERVMYPVAIGMGLFFFVCFGVAAWNAWGRLPHLATLSFGVGSVFGLVFSVYAFRVWRRGRLHLKKDLGLFNGLIWGFMVIMMTVFLMLGQQMEDTEKGTQIILVGLVFFVTFGVVGMLQYNIQQAELRIRESVVKLELQVAELMERFGPEGEQR